MFNANSVVTCGQSVTLGVVSHGSGSINMTSGGTLQIGTTFTAPNGSLTAGSGTIDYNGTGAQTVTAFNYNNLTLSGARTVNNVTLASSGTIGVAGTLTASATFSTGGFVNTGSTVNYNGGAQNVTGFSYNNLTTSGSNTKTASANLSVAGVLTIGSGTTFDASSRTITLSGSGTPLVVSGTFTPSTSTVSYTSGSGANVTGANYNNLTINGTGTFSAAGNLSIAGTLNVQGGSFDANGKTVSVTGLTTVSGGSYLASTATQTLTGGLTVSGGTFTGSSGTVTAGNVTLSTGTLTAPNSSGAFNVSGNWTNNGGTFTHNSGTVTFNGTGAQSIGGSATTAFNSLTDANTSAALSANTSFSAAGTLTVNASALLTPAAAVVISGGGTLTGNGTVQVTKTGTADDFSNQYTITTKTLTNLTVEFTGASAQNSSTASYGSLKINNASGVTLQANTTVGATLTFASGKITTGANTLIIGTGGSVAGAAAGKYVFGNLQKNFLAGTVSFTYDVGDSADYEPLALTSLVVNAGGGNLKASTTDGNHPQIGSSGLSPTLSVTQYWTLTAVSGTYGTYNAQFTYPSSHSLGTAASYIARRYNGSTWSTTTLNGTPTSTSTSISGVSGFGDFAIGQQAANAYRITPNGSPTAGVNYPLSITLVDSAGITVNFSGDKNLTFSGLSDATDGTHPTVTDKSGSAVNLGAVEPITFASGVSSAGGVLKAYKGEGPVTLAVHDDAGTPLSSANTGGTGATLTIANVAPVANDTTYQRGRNTQLRIPISSLLTNVTDANHDYMLSRATNFVLVSSPSTNGITVLTNSAFVLYSATNGGNFTDQFSYVVMDGSLTSTGRVVVTITPDTTGTNANAVSFGVDGSGHPTMTFAGVPGFTYLIQSTPSLSGTPTWTTKLTTNAPATGLFQFTDTTVTTSFPFTTIFYRAINQ